MPSEKLQRHHPMMRKMEEINCVDDLLRRHVQVDDTEIIFQSMSDENYSAERKEIENRLENRGKKFKLPVDEITKLLIRTFERRQTFVAQIRVQIARFNPGKLREIICDLFTREDVVVDEGKAFLVVARSAGRGKFKILRNKLWRKLLGLPSDATDSSNTRDSRFYRHFSIGRNFTFLGI